MSKKSRKNQNPQYQFTTTTWEKVLGPGYKPQNVAYDFGESPIAAAAIARFQNRACAISQRAANWGEVEQKVAELETEVQYLESAEYTKHLIADWLRKNWGSAAFLFFIGSVIGSALVRIAFVIGS